jgi:cyclophilin family peptidyl-prolyl cis-trans isomerase
MKLRVTLCVSSRSLFLLFMGLVLTFTDAWVSQGRNMPSTPVEGLKRELAKATATAVAVTLLPVSQSGAEDARKPEITNKVKLDIKIANYTEESIGTNKGATGSGSVIIGLYGKEAPLSVNLFLNTVRGDGVTSPSFFNAQFQRITPLGLLEMDKVRGVNKIDLAGSESYEYMGNVLNEYKPILENNDIHHTRAGLLTRKQLSSTPEFSITTKDILSSSEVDELDSFHCVFGEVLEGAETLDAIKNIPLYTYQTATGYAGGKRGVESGLADKWFSAQREFYVNAGKALGDTRAVDLRGKLLRRVVVKRSEVL